MTNEAPAEPVKKRSATDRIREKLLGAPDNAHDVWVEFQGERYLLVPPSVKKRSKILEACLKLTPKKNADGEATGEMDADFDNLEMLTRALCACLRDPETRELVFPEEAQRSALMEAQLSPLFDFLAGKSARILNPKVQETEKNSAAAPGTSSSTVSPQS